MGTRQVGLKDIEETAAPRRLRLLAPLRYLIIDAPEKRFYDVTLPLLAAALCWLGYNAIEPRPAIFGDSGILVVAQSFLIMAVPFLIGALAAVAMGSPGTHLDRRAVGVGISLEGKALTLRQFVSYLLGYLCFVGLVTFLFVTALIFLQPSFANWLVDWPITREVLSQAGVATIFALFSTFTITVFWALYFLTDIVNRHD
jgi:hypothetical protein